MNHHRYQLFMDILGMLRKCKCEFAPRGMCNCKEYKLVMPNQIFNICTDAMQHMINSENLLNIPIMDLTIKKFIESTDVEDDSIKPGSPFHIRNNILEEAYIPLDVCDSKSLLNKLLMNLYIIIIFRILCIYFSMTIYSYFLLESLS